MNQICSKCQKPLPPGGRFCQACGQPAAQAPTPLPPVPPMRPAPQKSSPIVFLIIAGAVLVIVIVAIVLYVVNRDSGDQAAESSDGESSLISDNSDDGDDSGSGAEDGSEGAPSVIGSPSDFARIGLECEETYFNSDLFAAGLELDEEDKERIESSVTAAYGCEFDGVEYELYQTEEVSRVFLILADSLAAELPGVDAQAAREAFCEGVTSEDEALTVGGYSLIADSPSELRDLRAELENGGFATSDFAPDFCK